MSAPSTDQRTSLVSRREFYAVIAVMLLIDISVLHADRGSELVEDLFTAVLTIGVLVAIALAWRSGRAT